MPKEEGRLNKNEEVRKEFDKKLFLLRYYL